MEEHAGTLVHWLWGLCVLLISVIWWMARKKLNELEVRMDKFETDLRAIEHNYIKRFEEVRRDFSEMRIEMMRVLHNIEKLVITIHASNKDVKGAVGLEENGGK